MYKIQYAPLSRRPFAMLLQYLRERRDNYKNSLSMNIELAIIV